MDNVESLAQATHTARAELTGNIQFMSLGTIISINCNENRTIRIEIENKTRHAEIYIQNGNIVHAITETEIGEQAFYEILTLREGTFNIFSDEMAPQVSIKKNWSTLLLEGMRRLDENSINERQEFDWSNFVEADSGVEQVEKILADRMKRMVKALRRLEGVLGVTAISNDFRVLENDAEYDVEEYVNLANNILMTGKKLGNLIGVKYLKHALIINFQNTIVLNREQDCIILATKKNVTTEVLLDEIYTIMKRYRLLDLTL